MTAGALAVLIGSALSAYATFSFWETGPVVTSVLLFAAASAGAIYTATRRLLLTFVVAACLAGAHLALLTAITLGRWGG